MDELNHNALGPHQPRGPSVESHTLRLRHKVYLRVSYSFSIERCMRFPGSCSSTQLN